MMRLTTIGRRSGQPRVAIIGYYEDGPNLVTLAMNGWADAEPAWWLNLQAQPDTTVELPDGPRAVRARAAAGEERERLWATFRDYPGWGDDIDARRCAAIDPRRRWSCSSLGPRGSRPDHDDVRTNPARGRRAGLAGSGAGTSGLFPGSASRSSPTRRPGPFTSGWCRSWCSGSCPTSRSSWGSVSRMRGASWPRARCRCSTRCISLSCRWRCSASPWRAILPPFWLVGALAWLSHIVVDRGFGDGLRTADGYLRGGSGPTAPPILGVGQLTRSRSTTSRIVQVSPFRRADREGLPPSLHLTTTVAVIVEWIAQ